MEDKTAIHTLVASEPSSATHKNEWMQFSRFCSGTKVSKEIAKAFSEKGPERLRLFSRFVALGCDPQRLMLEVEQVRAAAPMFWAGCDGFGARACV